jgi:hypothetical protein
MERPGLVALAAGPRTEGAGMPHERASRSTRGTVVYLLVAVLVAVSSHALAGFRGGGMTGMMNDRGFMPALDLTVGATESDTEIQVFMENYGVCLGSISLAVDIDTPGLYTESSLAPGTLTGPVGINSYFIHADQTGSAGTVTFGGRVTFEERILGIIVTDANLDDSDWLGYTGTPLAARRDYPHEVPLRGLDTVGGGHTVNFIDRNTLQVSLSVEHVCDQIRVITEAMDHFQAYDLAESEEILFSLELQGQFDDDLVPTCLNSWSGFANPAWAQVCGIARPRAHFTWYDVVLREPQEPERRVEIFNRFNTVRPDTLTISQPVHLMVPAEKTSDEGSGFPIGLDHYLCYRVLSGAAPDSVMVLRDQWSRRGAEPGDPVLFCVPVSKRHSGQRRPIKNATDHFTVYEIDPQAVGDQPRGFSALDQFSDDWANEATESILLCVPTLKLSVEEAAP